MKIKSYLRQTALWEPRTGTNKGGDATYAAPVTIGVRKEVRERMLRASDTNPRAADGVEKPSTTTYMSEEEIGLGDKLDGEIVQARTSITDFKGIIGWTSYMEPVYRSS